MASFSTLEQTTNMAKANERMASSMALSQSVSLIGRTVSYTDAAGANHSGIVEKVSTTKEGAARLTVGGIADVDPATITQVA
jgi:flagellar basal-body rod modification protein FlgD